jgi:hypothetical protein
MEYTIERVGQMALGIVSEGREHVERKHVELSLLGLNQFLPSLRKATALA